MENERHPPRGAILQDCGVQAPVAELFSCHVGQNRHAEPVAHDEIRVGVHIDLVEGDATAGERGLHLVAEMAAAPAVEDEPSLYR